MKKNILFIFLLIFSIALQAQDTVIKGFVINSKGKPIENASVIIKKTAYGTYTNAKGEFTLSVPLKGPFNLITSLIGYQKNEKKIHLVKGSAKNISFTLKESSENLDEVLITAQKRYLKSVILKSSATKSNLKLLNTPASIATIDKSIIEDQAITTIQGAIKNISGITQSGNNYGVGDNLIIRGLGANYAYDGMYGGGGLGNSYNPSRTMTNIERVEVLKGPVTGLYGIGSAGGLINMIEKQPLSFEKIGASIQAGSWNHYRIMADASLPFSKKTAFRIVLAKESTDGFRNVEKDVNELHTSFKYKLAENNTFVLSASYIDDKNQVESIGNPVRIFNRESLTNPNDTNITWEDLLNDTDNDNDGVLGIQLTQEQRKQLANSITANEGTTPFDLNGGNLISPLSKPNDGKELRVKLRNDWSINSNTELTQQLLYRNYSTDFTRQTGAYNYVYWDRSGEINANPRAPLVINDILYPYAARRQEYRHQESKERVFQYFADFKNKWKTSNIKGQHLVSYNYQDFEASSKSWSIYDADGAASTANPVPYILDIRNPNWGTGTFWDYSPVLRSNYVKNVQNFGISLQEVVQLFDDKLTARIGGAYSSVTQKYTEKGTVRNGNTATPQADTDDAGFTYNVGLNYNFIKNLAAYVNYAKGRTAYSILGSVTGQDDRPDSESKSIDAGLRFSFQGQESKLYASATYFETSRTNLRYSNILYNDNINEADYNISVPQYFFDNKDKTKGVELDISFAFDKNWSLNTNGTYQDAVSIRSKKVVQRKGIPQKFLRTWAEYRLHLPELQNPIRFNFGYQYTSKRTINSASFGLPTAFLPEYSVWNTAVSFQYKEWDLRVNIDNLFNKKYYSRAMFLGGLPGETRNYTATLKYNL